MIGRRGRSGALRRELDRRALVIQIRVAAYFGVSVGRMRLTSGRNVLEIRACQVAMYLLRANDEMTWTFIAEVFGRSMPSSVRSCCETLLRQAERSASIRADLATLGVLLRPASREALERVG